MRAVIIEQFGGPETLTIVEAPEPTAGPGQVLVQVSVSGINFIDAYQRGGVYPMPLPLAAGVEGTGIVTALGDGVTGVALGQRVGWLSGGQGSFCDVVAVQADKLIPIPDDFDDVWATALLMQGVTAHFLATDTFRIKPGDVALVHAAAGGVGLLLTQIIRHLGGSVIATASSAAKRAAALTAGADHALPYEDFASEVRELTGGVGVDVVYDGVGAATAEGSLTSVRPRGLVVFFGNASGKVPPIDPLQLSALGSIYITRPTGAHYNRSAEELRARAADLFEWARSGVLHVTEPTRFDLTDIAAAFTALESRQTTGKLVLMH